MVITPSHGKPPTTDGQVRLYETPKKTLLSRWYKPNRPVIYINGQVTTGLRHMQSAWALSLLQMRPVIGIFNQSAGESWYDVIFDTFQSLGDKWQFDGPAAATPAEYFEDYLKLREKRKMPQVSRTAAMAELLGRNKATLAAFHLLRSQEVSKETPVFAHSQGNLILSNALTAIAIIDGPNAIQGWEVYSYGSPTIHWPAGIRLFESAFTGDPVALLNPYLNFTISKMGLPTGVQSREFISHDFMLYLKDDAQFVINRFRWGGWGMTLSLDEDGLATALVGMDDNEPRIRAIFERLDTHHNTDADDVACAYVTKMQSDPKHTAVLNAMKQTPLIPLLIRLMTEGWTSGKEKACISYLKSL